MGREVKRMEDDFRRGDTRINRVKSARMRTRRSEKR